MTDAERAEKAAAITEIVRQFARDYWDRLAWQAGQLIPGADAVLGEKLPPDAYHNPLPFMMEAQEWLVMARAGAGLLGQDPETRYNVREICQSLAEWLFAVPGSYHYGIPRSWQTDTDMGRLWAAAIIWAEGDELITLTEAADLAGVTVQAISGQIARGTLAAYSDPTEPNPQRQKRVRRSDIGRTP